VDVGSGPVMLAIQPVYSRDASDGAVIGYVVEMKKVVGRGRETIEHLVGRGVTMIIGDPGEGVWTDLTSTVPGPPPRAVAGRALRFSASSRGPGIGYGRKIQGTPWMIWMQQSSAQVLAPLTEFLWAIATAGILIAVVGGLLVWVFARSITKRIVTLIDKVELIESDTGSRPPRNAPARDEIERLCDAFERMAARLKAHALKEIEFLHGQKVEAVGRLAAGVAHDFNNILMAIRSFAHFQLEELPQGSSLRENAEEIYKASSRGAELTKQLLAFTRKKDPERTAVNLAEIAVNMTGMLRRLVPKNIDFVVDASSGLWPVAADQTHVEQVIVNLAVNARDAMPRGGVLRLTLSNETVATPIRTSGRQIPAGPYVVLRISDTGVGMTEAVRLRIFEPFFTTKSEGSGTGLGLSTVFSIVDHWDGHITVESRVGVGTTFSVYFPRSLAVLARGSEAVRQADRVA
jgi:signal transduction histidine kinase